MPVYTLARRVRVSTPPIASSPPIPLVAGDDIGVRLPDYVGCSTADPGNATSVEHRERLTRSSTHRPEVDQRADYLEHRATPLLAHAADEKPLNIYHDDGDLMITAELGA